MPVIWLICLLLAVTSFRVQADIPVPPLQQRITDLTGTLAQDQRAELERRLASFESEKGSQIAVLLVPTTQPETIEQYSIRVVEDWKLGRKGIDDGILVLVAKQDRSLRIEVGQGLEGVVPDAIAKRIVEDVMVPYFRQGDVYGGLSAGIDRLIAVIHGEPLPSPQRTERTDPGAALGVAVMAALFGGQFLRFIFGPLAGGLIGGVGAGILLLLFGLPILVAALVGLFVSILIMAGLGRGRSGGYYGGPGGFGGGSGSGGFSGGGGGFSGGGASGRW